MTDNRVKFSKKNPHVKRFQISPLYIVFYLNTSYVILWLIKIKLEKSNIIDAITFIS